jgi:hypothetical protein
LRPATKGIFSDVDQAQNWRKIASKTEAKHSCPQKAVACAACIELGFRAAYLSRVGICNECMAFAYWLLKLTFSLGLKKL